MGKLLVWRWKNNQKEKYLEEHVARLDKMNDETSCFGFMHQCHFGLMRNENNEDWEREVCEHNELFFCNKKWKKKCSTW